MATSIALEDYAKCRICLSSFTKPRMLKCLHTFCSPCLEKLVEDIEENTNIRCPLCRSEVMLPVNGIAGLESPDFFPIESNDLKNQDISLAVCQVCDKSRVAFVKCIDCNEYMCKECHKDHGKFNAMKDHELEYLQTHVTDCDKFANEQCKEHNKDLTLFCKPCNNSLCTECQKTCHSSHDVISLFDAAATERNILIAGIRGLKSKMLPIIESTLEEAKTEENNFSKHCSRIKQEIRAHATGLKEVFVRNVDLAMNANIAELEKLKKDEIKKMESYIDRLETDKLSFASLLHTSESIVDRCSENQIVKVSPKLRLRMNDMNNYLGVEQVVHEMKYESGEISEQDIMRIVGSLTLVPKTTLKPSFRQLPIPDLRLVKSFNKVNSFNTVDNIMGIVGGLDSNALILHSSFVCLNSKNGESMQRYEYDYEKTVSKLLKTRDGTIYVWGVNSATKLGDNSAEEFYKVPFENGIVGCFISSNNLVVYKPDDKTLYEVNATGDIQRKVNNARLSAILYNEPINMIETSDKNWVIVQKYNVITLRPDGIIQNIFNNKFDSLPSVCSDRYGNVFLLSSTKKVNWCLYFCEISLGSADGVHFSQIHKFESNHEYPKHMTVDGHGNLWCTGRETEINIYSYM